MSTSCVHLSHLVALVNFSKDITWALESQYVVQNILIENA